MSDKQKNIAHFHLPGLFEFYEFYKAFLPVYRNHKEFFYDWADITSIYGAPDDCLWSGGRLGLGDTKAREVLDLLREYRISGRLTFSNSLIRNEHLTDRKCNKLCRMFEEATINDIDNSNVLENGVIVHSDLLLDYLKDNYKGLYLVSSTTKVLTDFDEFKEELNRKDFRYVVPDFRLNKQFDKLNGLTTDEKDKIEFLCNECCYIGCTDRKKCYENVSRKALGEDIEDHICTAPNANAGYMFSKAMQNPSFISVEDIVNVYLPNGFSNFKIEGRSLGSAIILEFLLYYMVKPECQINVREMIYLDSVLNLF